MRRVNNRRPGWDALDFAGQLFLGTAAVLAALALIWRMMGVAAT